jgi:hypothetical protein
MKALIIILSSSLLAIVSCFAGGMPVIDAVAIANQKIAAHRAYLEQALQGVEQIEQTLKLTEQIRQLDSYLERFGDPSSIKDLEGFDELYRQLNAASVLKLPELNREDLHTDEVFRPLASNIGQNLQKEIIVDGKVEATRDGEIYAPEVAERRTQEDYQQVRASVLTRREVLRTSIAGTTKQIQQASTASEVQKLGLVLTGLQTELHATDRELDFAAKDMQARVLANATEREIMRKAAVEEERARLRVGIRKDAEIYKLFTTPIRFAE